MSKEAMKLALDGKSLYDITGSITDIDKCIIHRFDLIQALAALAKQEHGEPWGACVSGRVFVGALPKHVRKLSEDEGLPIQWLYTTPQQRKPLEPTVPEDANINQRISFKAGWKAAESAHGIKETS